MTHPSLSTMLCKGGMVVPRVPTTPSPTSVSSSSPSSSSLAAPPAGSISEQLSPPPFFFTLQPPPPPPPPSISSSSSTRHHLRPTTTPTLTLAGQMAASQPLSLLMPALLPPLPHPSPPPLFLSSSAILLSSPLGPPPPPPPPRPVYASGSETAITSAVDPALFVDLVDEDYICKLCSRVPMKEANLRCCGTISCVRCLESWIVKENKATCPFCRAPATSKDIVRSSFVARKLAGLKIRCRTWKESPTSSSAAVDDHAVSPPMPPAKESAIDDKNTSVTAAPGGRGAIGGGGGEGGGGGGRGTEEEDGKRVALMKKEEALKKTRVVVEPSQQCERKMLFGLEGSRWLEHMSECGFEMVTCGDCKQIMQRSLLAKHQNNTGGRRPQQEKEKCADAPMQCVPCGITLRRVDMEAHELESSHAQQVLRKCAQLSSHFQQLQLSMVAMRRELELKQTVEDNLRRAMRTMAQENDEKVAALEARTDQKLLELRTHMSAEFVEFEISKWSEVKDGAALFSTATPLKVTHAP